jgi:hypothetical protein
VKFQTTFENLSLTFAGGTAMYLYILSYLPNRVFYIQLSGLTSDQWTSTLQYLIKYTAFEMLSFVLLTLIMSHMTQLSTLRQLAFTLEKHWVIVQAQVVLWFFFPIQMSLEHLGTVLNADYAFYRKTFPFLRMVELLCD